ncbi:hypothetical protein AB6A40_006925 [Gnathostoma spinigerum]|uniref:Superoxide dismutase [Cu-Zn] n=1 Tax=Gnathostoma spinigerum TaxID=75299 RepID=A0ABD6ERY5_9BILA
MPYKLIGVLNLVEAYGKVNIKGNIANLTPGYHGFHVHEKGDIGNGCLNAAGHFNPFNQNHGAPSDLRRHAGDLGNLIAQPNGVAYVDITDSQITLSGPLSIVGRSFVVHENADDLGRGNSPTSLTTGNSGGRVACGVIALA